MFTKEFRCGFHIRESKDNRGRFQLLGLPVEALDPPATVWTQDTLTLETKDLATSVALLESGFHGQHLEATFRILGKPALPTMGMFTEQQQRRAIDLLQQLLVEHDEAYANIVVVHEAEAFLEEVKAFLKEVEA